VLGYELINEPWAGDIYRFPQYFSRLGEADKVNLIPFYTLLHQTVRKNDNNHLVFYEKATVDIFGASGFTAGPGGKPYNDRQVYSYHVYCGPNDPQGDPRNIIECAGEDFVEYEIAANDARRLGGGGFMTEFGAVGNTTTSIQDIDWITDAADAFFQSWAYWQFKYFADLTTSGTGEGFYNKEGVLEENKLKALSRSYPQAVAGLPTYFSFEPRNAEFKLEYHIDLAITQPTEIYLNEKYYYPKGYTVSITPTNTASWSSTGINNVQILPINGVRNNTAITVIVRPK